MSADRHLTQAWLKALAARKVTPGVLRDLVLEHLFALCPVCAREYAAWVEERQGERAYDRAFRPLALPSGRHDEGEGPRSDPKRVERDFKELSRLAPEESLQRIERALVRFRGQALAERLLAESDRHLPGSPRDAFRFADLAYLVAIRSGPEAAPGAVRAAARKANAQRVMGNHDYAERLFSFAHNLAGMEKVASTLVSAELDRFEGTLRLDQHRFREAETLLHRARIHYEMLDDRARCDHLDLKLSHLQYRQGDIAAALETALRLYERLNRELDPVLYLCTENDVALYFCDAGRHEEALAVLDYGREFCTAFADQHVRSRRLWVAGRAAAAFGDLRGAEEALLIVRDLFVSEEAGYDAAMVSLDLALVYAKGGRHGDLRATAEAMAPIFRSYGLHREAAAAVRLFIEAVREESASVAFVEEVATFLRRSQFDLSLSFRRRHDVN